MASLPIAGDSMLPADRATAQIAIYQARARGVRSRGDHGQRGGEHRRHHGRRQRRNPANFAGDGHLRAGADKRHQHPRTA